MLKQCFQKNIFHFFFNHMRKLLDIHLLNTFLLQKEIYLGKYNLLKIHKLCTLKTHLRHTFYKKCNKIKYLIYYSCNKKHKHLTFCHSRSVGSKNFKKKHMTAYRR